MRDQRTFPELYGGGRPHCGLSPKEAQKALARLDRQYAELAKFIPCYDHDTWLAYMKTLIQNKRVFSIKKYHIRKYRHQKQYQDRHALTRPPRAVHREECWVCGNLYAMANLRPCTWCEESLMCPDCVEDHVGFCTEDCMANHQWSIAGIGRR